MLTDESVHTARRGAANAAGVNAKWLRAAPALLTPCLRLQCEAGVRLHMRVIVMQCKLHRQH